MNKFFSSNSCNNLFSLHCVFICEGILSDFIVLTQSKYNFHLFTELCFLQEIKALKKSFDSIELFLEAVHISMLVKNYLRNVLPPHH